MPITIPIPNFRMRREVYNLYEWTTHLNERIITLEKEVNQLIKWANHLESKNKGKK